MSLFDWLMPKSKPHKNAVFPVAAAAPGRQGANAHAPDADLKAQRQERRERLYAVVREAMLRSEVLASRYKFKVLSLDTHGRQFLVMVDLLDARAVSPDRFTVIEQLIISHAAQQHGMYVKAVYWRVNDVSAMATPPVSAPVVRVAAPVSASLTPIPTPIHTPVFDPIDQAEVLAFKKAIGAIPIPSAASAGTAGQARTPGPRDASVMTGYEDTQLLEQPDDAASPLSRTQFGEL